MSIAKDYRVNLIEDAPAFKDEFGAHARLADAIAELIDSHDGGISIGLEGGWGSGKSTVVNLLKERYEKKNDHAVILFDAWAHQGDPLRRTFLETVIKRLEQVGWVDTDKWEKTRAELAQRRRVTETKSIPRLGKLGSLLALAVLLIPVGLTLFSAGLQASTGTSSTPNWMLAVGFILTLIPVVILLLSFLPRLVKWAWKKVRKQPIQPGWNFGDFGALMAQKYVEDTRTETIENPDPTSVEFEETFTNLITEALDGQNRCLILAFDNLDRVTPTDALSILAVLQTFLQHSEHNRPDWFKKLYVLIPYDPSALQRLWKVQSEEEDGRVATAFLDKMFQLRFEVPPLLLSDWRSYLINLFKQALPDHNEAEFHGAYRVFALRDNRDNVSPTPRDLKLFVNQIGTINRQWQDKFPLTQVAYYVLQRRNRENVPDSLLKRKIPQTELLELLGEDPHGNLAAMAFNVPVQEARQLLLRSPLEESMGKGDATTLKDQSTYPGFWEVLQDIPFKEWAEKESTKLANAALCLDSDDLLTSAEPAIAKMIVNSLKAAAYQVEAWTPLNLNGARGITSLLRLSPDAALAEAILQRLPPALTDAEQRKNKAGAVSPWVEGLIHLLKGVKALNLADVYSDGVSVEVDADGYIELCAQIYMEDPDAEFWSVLRPEVQLDEVTAKLSTILSSEVFATNHVNAVRVMKQTQLSLPWNKVTAKMIEGLKSGNAISPPLVTASLTTLWELRDTHASIDVEIGNLATQGYVLHHLYHVRSDHTAGAWCIFLFLQRVPAVAVPQAAGNSQDGYTFLTREVFAEPQNYADITKQFTDLVAQLNQLSLLFTVLDVSAIAKAWVIECLKWVATQEYALTLFEPELLVHRWKLIEDEFSEEEYDNLITLMMEQSNLLQYLCGLDFDLEQAGLYTFLVQRSAEEDQEFHAWCQTGLNEVNLKRWQAELKDEGFIAKLVIDLLEKGIEVSLGTTYQDALVEHGKLVIAGKAKPKHLMEYWARLLQPLKREHRDLLRSQLLSAAERADGKIAAEFFDLYGGEIANYQTLRDNHDVVLNLFMPLLRERSDKGLEWLERVFSERPDVLDGYNATHVDGFKERLQEAVDDEEREASTTISSIAARLGIHRTEVAQEDTQEDA